MIAVSPRAAARAILLAQRENRAAVLRVGVQGGGCSGLSYFYRFDEPAADDVSFEAHGLTVVCDPRSLPYVDGCQLDFDQNLLKGGFRFANPRAKTQCSCGESFSV